MGEQREPDLNIPDPVELSKALGSIAERSQKVVTEFLERQAENRGAVGPVDPMNIGHAFFEVLELPVVGRQEDAADQLAILIALEANIAPGDLAVGAGDLAKHLDEKWKGGKVAYLDHGALEQALHEGDDVLAACNLVDGARTHDLGPADGFANMLEVDALEKVPGWMPTDGYGSQHPLGEEFGIRVELVPAFRQLGEDRCERS